MSEITERASTVAGPARPAELALVPRPSLESFFSDGFLPGFSPGPMTLVSSFFATDSDGCSFSQLLAGAMTSPLAKTESEKQCGYKQNRPMSLALSPSFVIPPGFSPSGLLSPLQSPFGMSHQQALAHVTAQAAFNQSAQANASETESSSVPNDSFNHQPDDMLLEPESLKSEATTMEVSRPLRRSTSGPSGALERPAKDGYRWRKYGQKVVKGSECPRSYYRCTHITCTVKKKVERSVNGHITEITYKGQHNHEIPNPYKRKKDDSTENAQLNPQIASRNWTQETEFPSDQLDLVCDPDEMEETSMALDEVDEQNPSQRSSEVTSSAQPSSHKTITEPRIVVQTRSEIDLLDDGFKWRKYGQKVVKGNVNPRSYYRCTYSGCSVRKHVERASADPGAVITTYEGKHSHDIPNARRNNRSHC